MFAVTSTVLFCHFLPAVFAVTLRSSRGLLVYLCGTSIPHHRLRALRFFSMPTYNWFAVRFITRCLRNTTTTHLILPTAHRTYLHSYLDLTHYIPVHALPHGSLTAHTFSCAHCALTPAPALPARCCHYCCLFHLFTLPACTPCHSALPAVLCLYYCPSLYLFGWTPPLHLYALPRTCVYTPATPPACHLVLPACHGCFTAHYLRSLPPATVYARTPGFTFPAAPPLHCICLPGVYAVYTLLLLRTCWFGPPVDAATVYTCCCRFVPTCRYAVLPRLLPAFTTPTPPPTFWTYHHHRRAHHLGRARTPPPSCAGAFCAMLTPAARIPPPPHCRSSWIVLRTPYHYFTRFLLSRCLLRVNTTCLHFLTSAVTLPAPPPFCTAAATVPFRARYTTTTHHLLPATDLPAHLPVLTPLSHCGSRVLCLVYTSTLFPFTLLFITFHTLHMHTGSSPLCCRVSPLRGSNLPAPDSAFSPCGFLRSAAPLSAAGSALRCTPACRTALHARARTVLYAPAIPPLRVWDFCTCTHTARSFHAVFLHAMYFRLPHLPACTVRLPGSTCCHMRFSSTFSTLLLLISPRIPVGSFSYYLSPCVRFWFHAFSCRFGSRFFSPPATCIPLLRFYAPLPLSTTADTARTPPCWFFTYLYHHMVPSPAARRHTTHALPFGSLRYLRFGFFLLSALSIRCSAYACHIPRLHFHAITYYRAHRRLFLPTTTHTVHRGWVLHTAHTACATVSTRTCTWDSYSRRHLHHHYLPAHVLYYHYFTMIPHYCLRLQRFTTTPHYRGLYLLVTNILSCPSSYCTTTLLLDSHICINVFSPHTPFTLHMVDTALVLVYCTTVPMIITVLPHGLPLPAHTCLRLRTPCTTTCGLHHTIPFTHLLPAHVSGYYPVLHTFTCLPGFYLR